MKKQKNKKQVKIVINTDGWDKDDWDDARKEFVEALIENGDLKEHTENYISDAKYYYAAKDGREFNDLTEEEQDELIEEWTDSEELQNAWYKYVEESWNEYEEELKAGKVFDLIDE